MATSSSSFRNASVSAAFGSQVSSMHSCIVHAERDDTMVYLRCLLSVQDRCAIVILVVTVAVAVARHALEKYWEGSGV